MTVVHSSVKTDWLAVFSRARFLNLEEQPNLFGPWDILARFQGILRKWISVQQSPGKTQGWGSFCNEVIWLGLESFLDPKIGNSIFRSCEISQVGTSTTRSASSTQHICLGDRKSQVRWVHHYSRMKKKQPEVYQFLHCHSLCYMRVSLEFLNEFHIF